MSFPWLSQSGDAPLFSVILPVFNAVDVLSEHLPGLVDYLMSLHVPYELIVFDDGSEDPVAIHEIATQHGARCLRHAINRGKGAAVRAGMLAATGKYRMFTDADVPFAHETFARALYALIVEDADVVVGDRRLPGANYFDDVGIIRRLASTAFSSVTKLILGTERFDTQCGFKAFRDSVAVDIFTRTRINRFAMDVEIFYIALHDGLRIARLPVTLESQGETSVRVVRDSFSMLRDLLQIQRLARRGVYSDALTSGDGPFIFISEAIPHASAAQS